MGYSLQATARERIGVVLGGGGARGVAHIGVLKVLERERIPVDFITGTSMGSIVGGLYAAGYRADEIEAILKGVDWKDLFNDDPRRRELSIRRKEEDLDLLINFQFGLRDGRIILPRGAIQGQKLLLLLRRLTLPVWDVGSFDNLPIPFRAVAADIGSGQPVVFREGDLAAAIRASMSVPAVFAPIRYEGKLLVDGGIVDNVPVDVAREMGAQRFVVVDVSAGLRPETALNSPVAISSQMLDALMLRITQLQLDTLQPGDVLLKPELGDIGSGSFDRALETIPLGEAAAEAALDKLRAFSVSEEEYAAFRARHRPPKFDTPLVQFLEVRTNRSRTASYVARRVSDLDGHALDVDALEREIGNAYGDGSYERVTWKLERRGDETGVVVEPVDKGWGPNFVRFGLQLSDDFQGANQYQITAQANFTGLNSKGAEWRNTVGLGRIAGLRSEFYQPWGDLGQYFADAYLDYRAFDQPLAIAGATLADYRLEAATVGVETGLYVGSDWRFLGGLLRGHDAATLKVGDVGLFQNVANEFGAVYLGATRDTLDNSQFPGNGSRFDFEYQFALEGLGSDDDGEIARLSWDKALSRGRNRILFGTRLASEIDGDNFLRGSSLLGGFLNLSGFAERELFGQQAALGRVVAYRRLGNESALFSLPFYVGASVEAGNVWAERDDVSIDSLIYGGSMFFGFESFLGPVFLGYGRAEGGHDSVYLSFGSLIRTDR